VRREINVTRHEEARPGHFAHSQTRRSTGPEANPELANPIVSFGIRHNENAVGSDR
jgi:hypothetical protein